MKWRSILVLAFVVFAFSAVTLSSPQKAFAQVPSYDSFKSNTVGLLDNAIAALGTANGTVEQTQANKELYQSLVTLLNNTKTAYTSTFDSGASADEPAAQVQLSATSRAYSVLTSGMPTPAQLGRVPGFNAIMTGGNGQGGVRKQLSDLMEQARNYNTDPNSEGGGIVVNANAPTNTAQSIVDAENGCSASSPSSWFTVCLDKGFAWLIKNTFLRVAGWFLWLSSQFLDHIVKVGIIGFKDWAPSDLYPIWQLVRQVISMFVVFSGLYIGFMYIIGMKQTFQRYFVWVAIFGIFVNFSYPLTRAAIDLSNIVSVSIYASALNSTSENAGNLSAGTVIMTKLGLGQLVSQTTSANNSSGAGINTDIYQSINSTPGALLVVAYVVYAAYIFFISAGLLMLRTLALSFIIIASPLLLVDSVIPKLGDWAQKLRQIFFQQISVSVVFMLMFYLAIRMINVFGSKGALSAAEAGAASVSNVAQMFNIIMMLVVLHIMIKVTKATSGSIGEMAAKYVGQVGGFATGAAIGVATGGAGLLARGTIGAAASRWAESDSLKNQQNTWLGRKKLDLATSLASSSYDLRKSEKFASVAGTMGGVGMAKGLGITGRLKNYNEAQKDYVAEVERRASSMTDERARNDYIQSQRGGATSTLQSFALAGLAPKGSQTDAERATAGLSDSTRKAEDEKFKKYATASKDVRKTLMEHETSEIYKKRFADIDAYLDPATDEATRSSILKNQSDDVKKTLRDQRALASSKAQNETLSLIKRYFETDPAGRDSFKDDADQKTSDLINLIEQYKAARTEDDKVTMLKQIASASGDSAAKAIISNDDIGNQAKEEIRKAYLEATGQQAQIIKQSIGSMDMADFIKNMNKAIGSQGGGQSPPQTPAGAPPQQPKEPTPSRGAQTAGPEQQTTPENTQAPQEEKIVA